ncbi:ThiF family adenylyltransferase [Catenulispora rubra]|uniref:ThiF family adenylyltransferase n=1 Tax=Catenulispora rubra TaxID=280293 RepID=UPI0018920453|nr:ThiF family adenylyltransferase [Catenulispora rubra]
MYPAPPPAPTGVDDAYDRQARLFGDRGQALLAATKVGVIGAGGAGSPLIQQLAHLGVGHLVVIDPDRIDVTNLSRVVGATRRDARTWLTSSRRLERVRRFGARFAVPKVRVAE